MSTTPRFLRLNHLRVMRRGKVAYDQAFHAGVNIIRGQNSSGKSTIADFIFFILGGEFSDWKDAASQCDEVQAEVETPRGKLTLSRQIASALEPILVYFGSIAEAMESSLEGWERFAIRRQSGRESYSQVMFRSLLIPEAQSEGAANITMHQLLRLCYADQRTPATRLFRFETFDTQNIREAVGDLICGFSSYEIYEVSLQLRERQNELNDIETRLRGLQRALPSEQALNTPELIHSAIRDLKTERTDLQSQVDNVDQLVNVGDVKDYLAERRDVQVALTKQRNDLKSQELAEKSLEFEIREIEGFSGFLSELTEKLQFAESTFDTIGSIEFTHCPACGEALSPDTRENHCVVCKTPIDPEKERSRYNQIRLDLEIQTRESAQLTRQKEMELDASRSALRQLRRQHEKYLSQFDLKFGGGNGPREAFLATRINRLGHIDAEIDFLLQSLGIAEEIANLTSQKTALADECEKLKGRNEALRSQAGKRRTVALSKISDLGAEILRSDFRQPEFMDASSVSINFLNDSISVGELVNFAESSNVFLKNTAILALFLTAGRDPQFHHPRFVLFDNIEDKGMEPARSHLFQQIIVDRATELEFPYQVIFTTSMMNPELELDDYTIGLEYTSDNRSLDLG